MRFALRRLTSAVLGQPQAPTSWRAPSEALGRLYNSYSAASLRTPFTIAFFTCLAKGSASDLVAQKVVEKKEKVNWRRNAAFALFSGAYLGCGQHAIYNLGFNRLFGTAQNLRTAVMKSFADSFAHVPFLYLPLYYACEETFLGGTPQQGLRRYGEQVWDVMTRYWGIWTVFHVVNFRFCPPEIRIASIASVSFVWLVVLSWVSHDHLEETESKAKADA